MAKQLKDRMTLELRTKTGAVWTNTSIRGRGDDGTHTDSWQRKKGESVKEIPSAAYVSAPVAGEIQGDYLLLPRGQRDSTFLGKLLMIARGRKYEGIGGIIIYLEKDSGTGTWDLHASSKVVYRKVYSDTTY